MRRHAIGVVRRPEGAREQQDEIESPRRPDARQIDFTCQCSRAHLVPRVTSCRLVSPQRSVHLANSLILHVLLL